MNNSTDSMYIIYLDYTHFVFACLPVFCRDKQIIKYLLIRTQITYTKQTQVLSAQKIKPQTENSYN